MKSEINQIVVVGSGSWGSTISNLLSQNGHRVFLWNPSQNNNNINETYNNKNSVFLSNFVPHKNVHIINDIDKAIKESQLIILAVPTQFQRNVIYNIKTFINTDDHILLNLSKGIEQGSLNLPHQIVNKIFKNNVQYATLNGPCHAEEVYKQFPTRVMLSSNNNNLLNILKTLFENNFFKVQISDDVIGSELAGTMKNVYAIVIGILDGLRKSNNFKSAILTSCFAEMIRFGCEVGGNIDTFIGLSGIGDLTATCYSEHSRNRFVGKYLSRGYKIENVIQILQPMIAEGIDATKSIYMLSKKNNIDLPIVKTLNEIILGNENVKKILDII